MADEAELDPLIAETWFGEPGICGSCIAWRAETRPGDEIATGSCRLRPELGRVPADLKKCDRYMQRGGFTYRPDSDSGPKRRRSKTLAVLKRPGGRDETRRPEAPSAPKSPKASREIQTQHGSKPSTERAAPIIRLEVRPKLPFPRAPAPKEIDLGGVTSVPVVRQALVDLVREELMKSRREMHPKFKGGVVRVVPTSGSAREIPADRFFAHLDRLLSSLSALEAKVVGLEDSEEMKRQVTGIRGSFTTFNVMFAYKDEGFTGT
ncbi:MAG: hypothetical protein HY791_31055 [Deltaproteobacteria bacterium]|nr:hypothetical protein [Deltaproteobacteria bacterium]